MDRIFLFLTILSFSCSVKLPSTFQKCNRKQPDMKECILKAAQDGLAQLYQPVEGLKIPSINPFDLPALIIGGQGAVAVEQKFRDCKLDGFHKMRFDKFEFDFEKKVLNFVGNIPVVRKLCQYELDGQVLLLPIKGTGPSTVVLKNVHVDISLKYEEVKKHNKTFLKFVSSELKLDPELVSFNFENLFNGDKRLGDNINQVLNDNWKEVFGEVKSGYIEAVNQILINVFTNFFAQISLEEALD